MKRVIVVVSVVVEVLAVLGLLGLVGSADLGRMSIQTYLSGAMTCVGTGCICEIARALARYWSAGHGQGVKR